MASFKVMNATLQDASAMATCFFDAFVKEPQPQAQFYGTMFPNTPSVHNFFETSLSEQMRREPNAIFLKAVDTNANDKMAGFIKWTPPVSPDSYWSDYGEDQDAELCDAFFGAMAENRQKLMGDTPHWFIELMGVSAEYHRKGAGTLLIKNGCELADRDGVPAYVDASPAAYPLYERFGFVTLNEVTMPTPFDWYIERFMVRKERQSQ